MAKEMRNRRTASYEGRAIPPQGFMTPVTCCSMRAPSRFRALRVPFGMLSMICQESSRPVSPDFGERELESKILFINGFSPFERQRLRALLEAPLLRGRGPEDSGSNAPSVDSLCMGLGAATSTRRSTLQLRLPGRAATLGRFARGALRGPTTGHARQAPYRGPLVGHPHHRAVVGQPAQGRCRVHREQHRPRAPARFVASVQNA